MPGHREQIIDRVRELAHVPQTEIPQGRWLDLPGRGRTRLTDVPGPTSDVPALVPLHAVGCTGMLTWFPAVGALRERDRVVTFDQRWHGRGIVSEHFSLCECADDVAVVAARIPGATADEAACGHAGCVLGAEDFVPVFVQAVNTTSARVRDTPGKCR